MPTTTAEQNKAIVTRFNREFIEDNNLQSFSELLAADCIDHSAPAGIPPGAEGVLYFFNGMVRPAFPDIKVEILDQVAEGDKVTTRKEFHATHKGSFMGIEPTGRNVVIKVIDILKVQDGKLTEHWGLTNLPEVLAQLQS